jgi:hypothetical protein
MGVTMVRGSDGWAANETLTDTGQGGAVDAEGRYFVVW